MDRVSCKANRSIAAYSRIYSEQPWDTALCPVYTYIRRYPHILRYGFVLNSVAGTADSILIREVCLCPLVRYHFNMLYNSGTVCGVAKCVWPGIRAVDRHN